MSDWTYPYCVCEDHPSPEPGYMVCVHIHRPQEIAHFEKATEKDMGVICCPTCYEKKGDKDYTLEHSQVWCASCVRETGLMVTIQ